MRSSTKSARMEARVAVALSLLLAIGIVSCGDQAEDGSQTLLPPELQAELSQDVNLMVLRPEDFGPTHRCDPTTTPGLAPAEVSEWCVRTPPAQEEGEEVCVLSGAFLFPEIGDAERFYTDFEQDQRLDLAKEHGLEIRRGQDPRLGDEGVLHTVTTGSADVCGLAGAPANAIWVSIREGKAVLRFELWALGDTASTDEALDLAAKHLKRAEMVPTLQPSQMLLQPSDLPAGFTLDHDAPVGLWGRATAFSNKVEGQVIGSLALPFRTDDEAAATLTAAQLNELPALILSGAAPSAIEPEEEPAPAPKVGDVVRALHARAAGGKEVYVVAFRRGPGLAAVVSVAEPGRFSLENVVDLALRQDRRIQDGLE